MFFTERILLQASGVLRRILVLSEACHAQVVALGGFAGFVGVVSLPGEARETLAKRAKRPLFGG